MVIVLESNIRDDDKQRIRRFLEKNSLRVNEIAGEEETIFGAVGNVITSYSIHYTKLYEGLPSRRR